MRKIPQEGVTSRHLQYIYPQDIRWFWPAHCGTTEHIWIFVFGEGWISTAKIHRICFLLFLAGFSLLKNLDLSLVVPKPKLNELFENWYTDIILCHIVILWIFHKFTYYIVLCMRVKCKYLWDFFKHTFYMLLMASTLWHCSINTVTANNSSKDGLFHAHNPEPLEGPASSKAAKNSWQGLVMVLKRENCNFGGVDVRGCRLE